eukprot:Phypoly_transcript_11337.p1 GENE.Phypoly_transcript_11337~~Phypoly_transcript_11337.p1  ORF type:complete len:332 (+),score=42.29 Phypoly_transcript_11337:107-1102(+)
MVRPTHAQVLRGIMQSFPKVRYCISYGSGSIPQKGYDYTDPSKAPMVDFIFGVDDPIGWHKENMVNNRNHYSFLGLGGPKLISHIQNEYGAHIYYNTLVQINSQKIKYGVISHDLLKRDLLNWDTFYVSGRMQKPVLTLQDDSEISESNKMNLKNALFASLLLLPETFDEILLYEKIASLSYIGDVRMKLAENPRKVQNMVSQNMNLFRNLYDSTIKDSLFVFDAVPSPSASGAPVVFKQKKEPEIRLQLLRHIPTKVQDIFTQKMGYSNQSREQVLVDIIEKNKEDQALTIGISTLVQTYSRQQTLKGLFTAGLFKSIVYASQKLKSSKR